MRLKVNPDQSPVSTFRRLRPFILSGLVFCRIFLAVYCGADGGVSAGETHAAPSVSQPRRVPFAPGETLIYECHWNALPAGEIILKTSDFRQINGDTAYHFVMRMASSSFVDIFYRFRSRIEAYADLDVKRSLLYKKKEKVGNKKKEVEVRFDWQENLIRYIRHGKQKKTLLLPPGTLDPLSAFYALRLSDLSGRHIPEIPVSDGKKTFPGKATVTGRETLALKAGTFDTYVLEPETASFGGIFKQSADHSLHLWISSDERRLPVKIKSRVLIGSITVELVSMEPTP